MTVPDLIHATLRQIRLRFYGDRTTEFCRDRNALIKAVARYGHACATRGWDLEPEFIARDLEALLRQIQQQGGPKGYLPIYLEGAVDRHIRLRAEEIQAEARRMENRVKRTIAGIRTTGEGRPQSSPVEVLDSLWRQLRGGRPRKTQGAGRRAQGAVQPSLF